MPSTATQVIERPNRQWKDETSNLVANFEDVARHVEEEASDSGSPIPAEYTALGGDDTLKGMTNFSAPELDALWALVEPAVTITWTQGRGRKPSVSGKDALFITLIVLKHYDTWQKHATDFNIGMSPLEKMVHRAIQTVEPCCVAVDVSDRLPGSTADPTTMRDRLSIHRQMLRKEDESNPEKEVDRLSSLKCGLYW
ncbi:hypothetical protein PC116_g3920 [Phytophthora cactorum]|uniref:Uncharacterized protein n=1 Tax=Phytophthora cactorum TaxID=29920 RepID=A0A329SKD4_9STRA|nr:hypothetical protein PC111_g2165 [Phytophthora cactorum]KAG2928180.1 hypothetical protein PC114_g3200 [Phytophthora cactorum]KAG2997517.1 hypothetical protein PC119_g17651 [Phytophthora cactorum]KAG3188471.1 hypothetical protein C6341_g2711 [Phytophthora cactorum]KAG4248349.1 hypothetical protein PC116_g3920 [Phytophthora cactorum]